MASGSTEHSFKRKITRITGDDVEPISSIEKHDFLWFSDGTIVLSARSMKREGCEIRFKVHKSLLAKHSTVFRDMFELPEGVEATASQETFEGIPLVHVHDPAADWVELLHLLHGGYNGLSFRRYDPNLELSLMGTMRLIKKYDFPILRAKLVSWIEAQWPRTLDDWQLHQHYKQHVGWTTSTLEPAAAIRLATECDIPSILPIAFYLLSSIPIDADWDARELANQYTGFSARWNLLTNLNYSRLLRGKDKLLAIECSYRRKDSLLRCAEIFDGAMTRCCREWANTDVIPDGLDSMGDILELLESHAKREHWESLCPECCDERIEFAEKSRKDVWERLPQLFGLGEISGCI